MGKRLRVSGTNKSDVLSGIGGSTAMSGGRGDDTYLVDDLGDVASEKGNGGTDTVISTINWTLGKHLEHLTLDGDADLTGTGNGLANSILGNAGGNLLMGLDGNDTLSGGAGSDTLEGGNGDDTLSGDAGADFLDGGDGTDAARFAWSYLNYDFLWVGSDLLVTNAFGETDTLRNIEYLVFDDQTLAAADIGAPAPQAPVAVDDALSLNEDAQITWDVMQNDSGSQIAVSASTDGGKGAVSINANGTVTYAAWANAFGSDQFTYTIVDSQGLSSTATVTVQIAAVNDAPDANADSYATDQDTALSSAVSVLSNDSDADGDALVVSAADTASTLGGSVQMNADGTFTYTPAIGVSGSDSFTYSVDDGNGGTATSTVSIEIAPAEVDPDPEPDPDPGATPYYVEGMIYPNDTMRLNYPYDIGTGVTVTYTFLDEVPSYNSGSATLNNTFQAFSAQQQSVTRDVLDALASMTGLSFVEVDTAEQATITMGLADYSGNSEGSAWYPQGNSVGTIFSDMWLDTDLAGNTIDVGSEAYAVLLHELAHTLGLDHADLPSGEESRKYTLMSAAPHAGMGNMSDGFAGYQLYDIAALQHLYGIGPSAGNGNDIYDFADFDNLITTIWDGGGIDTFDLGAATYAVTLDLSDGSFSTVAPSGVDNAAIAFGTIIENATGGSHDDEITGNDVANLINGGGGDDLLTGAGGDDIFSFSGAWGDDVITDFARGKDAIDLAGTVANFGQLDISQANGTITVSHLDNTIALQGVTEVNASDFLFA